MLKHDIDNWFKNINLIDYFENSFKKNTMGVFNAPFSTNKNFNSNKDIIIKRLVDIAITQITQATPLKAKFNQLQWIWLMEDTRFCLMQAVMEQVQFMVNNRLIWEKINSSNIESPNSFKITNESQNFLLKTDAISRIAKDLIDESGIKDYHLLTPDEFIYQDDQGQIYVVGKVDLDKIKELVYE